MKVLQVDLPGAVFTLLDLPVPTPGPGEALLRVEAVTTCPQWDLHLAHDEPMFVGHRFHYPYTPGQPGHEATGVVEAVGEGVTDLEVGDQVSAWRDGGHGRQGCYAQYVALPAENLIRVPSHLPWPATAPVELAMCVAAAILPPAKAGEIAGRRMGVMGLGPAGLIAAQMLRAEGAAQVVGFEPNPARRAFAAPFVDSAHDPRAPEPPVCDAVVDCVGAKASVEWALDHARQWVALFGVQRDDYTFAIRHYQKTLRGYPGHGRAAAEVAVALMGDGKLDLGALVTHTMPLERYHDAVALLERQEAVKVCFLPWAS